MSSFSKFEVCVLGIFGLTCTTVIGTCVYCVYVARQIKESRGGKHERLGICDPDREAPSGKRRGIDDQDGAAPLGECRYIDKATGTCDTGSDDVDSVAIELQILQIDKELMIYLNDEIGNHPDCRFPEMQFLSETYIGKANALNCKNMADLLSVFKLKGHMSEGYYDFLIKQIFEPCHYHKHDVWKKIQETQLTIASLREKLTVVPSLPYLRTLETSNENSSDPRFTYDAVVVYADTDVSREAAKNFQKDTRKLISNLKIILQEESGGAGNHILSEFDHFDKECMYVFVMVTEDLFKDALASYKIHSLLVQLIIKRQMRVVPVLVRSGITCTGPLSSLVKLLYYYYTENRNKEIFEASFRRTIQHGRQNIHPPAWR